MVKVIIIGTGNVATHLFDAFTHSSSVEVVQVYGRNKKSLHYFSKKTNTTTSLSRFAEADVYLLAISDDAIEDVSKAIPVTNKLVVHTSGGVDINRLDSKHRRGVFYPLQSFTKGKKISFSTIPICIEAENPSDLIVLQNLGESISQTVVEINSNQRSKLHLAAVFVNNFVNYLYLAGEKITLENKLDFDLLKPLILETAQKITTLSPLEAQTGPAKRNDQKTIKKHVHLLTNSKHKELYQQLTQAIIDRYGKKL